MAATERPSLSARRQCDGKQSDAASSTVVAVGGPRAGTGPPAPAARPGPAGAPSSVLAGLAASGGRSRLGGAWAASQAWISSSTSGRRPRTPGRAAKTSSGRSASSRSLQGQLAGASGRRRPASRPDPGGAAPIDSHGGPALRGRSSSHSGAARRRGSIGRSAPRPQKYGRSRLGSCAAGRRYALPLVCDGPCGPAPHGPDRISTDVCAGQCSLGAWDPAAQLQQALRRVSRAERSREQAPGASWRRARPCKRTTQGTQPVWRTRQSSARRSA